MMLTDADSNEDTKSTSLLADVTDDSCTLEYIEIVPLSRDTDGPCTTDCDSGNWSAQVKQENLTVVKQEPQDICPTTSEHLSQHSGLYSGQKGSCTNDGGLTADGQRHTGEQLYCCSQCGKCYFSPSGLCRHMNIHREKHKCTECGRCCLSSCDLAVHKRIHSEEKPFECSVCSKRFTQAGELLVHRRIHSGEKPYKCRMCDKAFSQSGALNRHLRVHTGDKLYKCLLCEKAYTQAVKLNKYMKVHIGDKTHK